MGNFFSLAPLDAPIVLTRHRSIVTPLPHPDSVPVLQNLGRLEPAGCRQTPPLVWDCAEDFSVYDNYGNRWIDWSSGGFVTNAGHGIPEVRQAIIEQVNRGLLHHDLYPSEERAELLDLLASLAPQGLDKVQLFPSDSEAIRAAITLARTHAVAAGGPEKTWLLSFTGTNFSPSFDPRFAQLPVVGSEKASAAGFDSFLEALNNNGIRASDVAGVLLSFQHHGAPRTFPSNYLQSLQDWCQTHGVTLICDETHTGLGRTGKLWSFEHYDVSPDLICCGSNLGSSLPMGALTGRAELLDSSPTASTNHGAASNPLACAAALAAIKHLLGRNLVENAALLERPLQQGLEKLAASHPACVVQPVVRGLHASLGIISHATGEADAEAARAIVERCFHKGLLLATSAHARPDMLLIAPPLSISYAAVIEGLEALGEALTEILDAGAAAESGQMNTSDMMEAVS